MPKLTLETPSLLYVIQQDRHCMPTSDYYFTSIKPEPIVIATHWGNNSQPTSEQAAVKDPIHQEADLLQPGETCIYPWILSSTQVPVLDLTNTKVTSTTELEEEYSHGREDSSTEECPM